MAEEIDVGCTRPETGPIDAPETKKQPDSSNQTKEVIPMIKVGKKAPDFHAAGYKDNTFINVKLSDYLGKWVLLCFYPGDFTFV